MTGGKTAPAVTGGFLAEAKASADRPAPPWLAQLRRQGASSFAHLGFPAVTDEEWRYTNLRTVAERVFRHAEIASGADGTLRKRTAAAAVLSRLDPLAFPAHSPHQLVFLNGRFDAEWSRLAALPAGVRAGSLAALLAAEPERIEPYLGRLADVAAHPLAALNTAFLEDGAVLLVPPGVLVAEPIHLLHVTSSPDAPLAVHPRTLLVLGDGSQARVVETYVGPGVDASFVNPVTEAFLERGAVLDHATLQAEGAGASHLASLHVRVDRDALYTSRLFSFGALLARNEIHLALDGEGANATLEGLYAVKGRQHADQHTVIDHLKPHGSSQELYKGILDGEGRGVFDGKIIVRKAASKTDARQTNKNLLLSEGARVDSKPQLTIDNNDVRCTHGSTTGRLDADALFYLRSRGLGVEAARSLLIYAFASELVSRVKVQALKTMLERWLLDWLEHP